MKKVIKFLSIFMIVAASLMVGSTNYHVPNDNVSLKDIIKISNADAESGEQPYVLVCAQCPGGVMFYCAMVSWDRCNTMPCGGGYC